MTAPYRIVTVHVTREHIAKGEPRRCSRCPVALALLAAFPDAVQVSVAGNEDGEPTGVIWMDDGQVLCGSLPPEADEFIVAFDNSRPVTPFIFEAEVTRL